MKKLFQNVTLDGKRVSITVENGIITKITSYLHNNDGFYDGALVLPPFNDPHIHIDSVLTAGEPRYNQSGGLFEGINIWRERKATLTKADFISRTNKLFRLYVKNGVQNIRAHVDVTGNKITIIKWALEQKKRWAPKLNIQIVAFPQDGVLSTKVGKQNMQLAAEYGVDVLGGIPHYELSQRLGWEAIEWILDLAKAKKLMVDMHCDEIDDGNSRFLEYLAAEVWKRNLQGRVTASHTTAFAHYNDAYVNKLWRALKMANLHFIANPLVNAHLGARFENINKGRGITRVKDLLRHDLNVAFGHDDVQDPWYSLGDANMMQVLFMGIHLCHLTGIEEINNAMQLITTNSARLMELKNYGVKVGNPANFIILNEKNVYDAIRQITFVRENIRNGKKIN